MTVLHRTRLVLAALCATLLMGLSVPATNAYVPRATHYHVGGAITLDTNLLSASGASAWAIDEYLSANTPLPPLGAAFMAAEARYGVNARFLLAAALHESGWGTSDIARYKHNLFGYNAYDRDPYRYATAYATYAANINATSKFIKDFYLTPGGRWWGGQPTLRSMQQFWSSSHRWGVSVSGLANSIHLDAFSGSAIRVGTPVVAGRLHGGDRASVQVAWKGSDLPAGVEFAATWTPVALDADVIAAASAGSAAPALGDAASASPTSSPAVPPAPASTVPSAVPPETPSAAPPASIDGFVAATPASTAAAAAGIAAVIASANRPSIALNTTRTHSADHGVTLEVATPRLPGQYRLSLELRDTGGGPLPKAERVQIPRVAVRVWADTSVSIDLAASPDGTGAVVLLTNTGRQAIAAQPALDPSGPSDPDSRAFSTLTVTATTADPANPAPVLLLAAPLSADLKPGASLTFQMPTIEAATGRVGNWLSAALNVPGNAPWVPAYAPVGAWFAAGQLSATVPPDALDATGVALVGPVPPQGSLPSASGGPMPTPMSAPAATPPPTPVPIPTPTAAAPTPEPTTAPVKHGTWLYSEHSTAVSYRGTWRDAGSAGYSGGNATFSTTPGNTATLTFTGSSVTWIGPMGPTRGRALVLIDGHAVATISLWRSGFVPQVALFARTFRSVGRHTLTIEVLSSPGHPYVAIDGFVVRS